MKSRWQRRPVPVTGRSVMDVPPGSGTTLLRLPPHVYDIRDEWLADGMDPTIVVKKLRREFGIESNVGTHRNRRMTMRKNGIPCVHAA